MFLSVCAFKISIFFVFVLQKSNRFSTKVSNAKKLAKPGPKPEAINQLLSKMKVDKEKKEEKFIKERDVCIILKYFTFYTYLV